MTRLYRKRPRTVTCQACGRSKLDVEREILHFSLTKVTYRPDGKMTMRGAGSIDLCEPCWRRASTRSRIRRRPARPTSADLIRKGIDELLARLPDGVRILS